MCVRVCILCFRFFLAAVVMIGGTSDVYGPYSFIRGVCLGAQGNAVLHKNARGSSVGGCFFLFVFGFFSFPSYISGVHHFWVRFLRI